MVLVGIILGKVLLSVGFIPTDINIFASALCKPVSLFGVLLLSALYLHISWICKGFKLSVSTLLCSVFIFLFFTLK